MMRPALLRRLLAGLAIALAGGTALAAEGFAFGLFGDTPYNGFERRHLPLLIAQMDAEPLAFVAHVGDIKASSERCDDTLYAARLADFQASHHPFVFVPGDNEWTDCNRRAAGGYDPVERLARLRQLFFADPRKSLGRNPMPVESQADDPAFAPWVEHQRWQKGPVLFATLNVPGSDNNVGRGAGPSEEFIQRSAAVKAWVADAFRLAREKTLEGVVLILQGNPDLEDFSAGRPNRGYRQLLEQLLAETRNFAGEVLFVHGDTHVHRINQPLADPASGALVENFTRVETFGSPFMGWVKVDVTPGSKPLFRFDTRHYSPGAGN